MKLFRFATVALLTGALVVACDDDEAVVAPVTPVAPPTPTAPAPIFGTVSGTVSVEGSGLSGVAVNLLGAASQSSTTGSSGGYSFGNVPAGTHGVNISGGPADVAFVTTATVVTITTSGQTATADFAGNYIRTSSISGTVTAGDEGVVATVTASGTGMLMDEDPAVGSSNTDGDFELTGLRGGGYTVTISDFGDVEFPVTSREVTVGVGLSASVSFNAPGEDPVTDPSDAFLVVTQIADATDEDDTYSGQVTVTLDVERGDARFDKLTLYVDGEEVASQSFGLAPAPAEDPELAAQQVVFTLSFNSAEYDPETGAVTYENGAHDIVAGLTVQGSTEEVFSNRQEVEFENTDGVYVAVSGQTRLPMIGQDGAYWYGGPGAGFDLTVLPVAYSGRSVPTVTLREGFCGKNAAASDAEAPYEFTPDCDGHEGPVVATSFSIGAAPVETLNAEDEVFSIKLDYAGPGAPVFVPNPNDREGGWINSTVDLVGKYDAKKSPDGWLMNGAAGEGVGGYTAQLRVGKDVEVALEATPSSSPTLPAGSDKRDAYCFVASAVDDLGNESALPDAADGCAGPEDSKDAIEAMDAVEATDENEAMEAVEAADAEMFSTLEAGVDVDAPTLVFTRDDKSPRRSLREFQVRATDEGGSGIHDATPVMARVSLRNADGTLCGAEISEDGDREDSNGAGTIPGDPDEDCANTAFDEGRTGGDTPVFTTEIFAGVAGNMSELDEMGYYTFAGSAVDKAGNLSSEITRTIAHDDQSPSVGVSLLVVGDIDGPFDVTILMADNLSIRSFTM